MEVVNIFPANINVLDRDEFPPGKTLKAQADAFGRRIELKSTETGAELGVFGRDIPRDGVHLECARGDIHLVARALITGSSGYLNILSDRDREKARHSEVAKWFKLTRRTLVLKSLRSLTVRGDGTAGSVSVSFDAVELRYVVSLLATGKLL